MLSVYSGACWVTNSVCHVTYQPRARAFLLFPPWDPRRPESSGSVGFVILTLLEESNLRRKDSLWPTVFEVPVTRLGSWPLVFGSVLGREYVAKQSCPSLGGWEAREKRETYLFLF